ncbi:hypothetical protein RJT34_27141 [Clitoria ternatea]|uniref:Uncharacterized protein n=1 Tax=Clitoria ternatea TaxID=43366 RepID=A0AAN9FBZ2_CLITE
MHPRKRVYPTKCHQMLLETYIMRNVGQLLFCSSDKYLNVKAVKPSVPAKDYAAQGSGVLHKIKSKCKSFWQQLLDLFEFMALSLGLQLHAICVKQMTQA